MSSADTPSPGTLLATGAASGIGRAVARAAAHAGYELLLLDRDDAGLTQTAAELSPLTRVVTRVTDVTDEGAVIAAVEETRAERAPLTAGVAAAGVEVLGEVTTLTTADWRRSLDVNLTGVFNTARAVLPELLSNHGSFVAVASDAGVTGAQGYAAYCAAKHGVIGLVKAMALDYGPHGVRVNAVAPAFVQTPMAERIFADEPEERDYYRAIVPLGRFATADEVAQAVLHLAGPAASYTNGMVYRIDGGTTAGYFRANH
jgi:meso-butanediol dehydrogenase / (S,S)-butanediol dehydrogenase / diacetyl reductase